VRTDCFRLGLEVASILVALLMLALLVMPLDTWRLPQNQAVYEGFDPNLIFLRQTGSPVDAVVDVSENAVRLKALHNSNLDVNLLTFSYGGDLRAEFDMQVLDNQQVSKPLSIILWNWRDRVKYSLDFDSSPTNLLIARTTIEDAVVRERILGNYTRGYLYHAEISRHKEAGIITVEISGTDAEKPPSGHGALLLVGGPNEPGYREVVSERMMIEGGEKYLFGAVVKLASGEGWYKLVVDWLDKEGRKLSSSNDWQLLGKLPEWKAMTFEGTAPPAAAFAELRLGAGNGRTVILLSDVFLRKANEPGVNFVRNAAFEGDRGWFLVGNEPIEPSERPQVVNNLPEMNDSITIDQAPLLFAPLPVSITLASSSTSGATNVYVENFKVVVPSQRMSAMRIEEPLAQTMVIILGAVGGILITIYGFLSLRRLLKKNRIVGLLGKPFFVRSRARALLILGSLFSYLVPNILLFKLGSHFYDFTSSKIWTYITAKYGFAELYHLSSLVTLPHHITGEPVGSAAFPYGPAMAYVFTAIGSIMNALLPSQTHLDSFLFDIAIKLTNVLFGLFSSMLIYSILRHAGGSDRQSLIGAMLYLFNPAIWFMASVWGETHTISTFFLLGSIWLAQNARLGTLSLAWASLFASALTRPQMLVPALLLGLIYLKSFSLRKTFLAFSFGVITTFIMLAPFLLAFSPSLPSDLYTHQSAVQQAGDAAVSRYMFLSNDAYNIWPLVTRLAPGLEGPSRIYLPSRTPFLGSLTFLDVSNAIFLVVFALLAITILAQRNSGQLRGDMFGLVATGMLAFTMIRTGGSVHHFTLALPLVLISIKSLKEYERHSIFLILSITTLLTMWGSIPPALPPTSLLQPSINPLTRLFTELYISDWFITLGTLVNTVALLWLGSEAMRAVLSLRKREK